MGSLRTIRRHERSNEELFQAIQKENIAGVMRALDAGADCEARTPEDGETPLMWACEPGTLNIMDLLLERGAGVNTPDFFGVTPLMYAAANETTMHAYEPVELLLKNGAEVNLPDRHGTTALMYATEAGQLRCVYRLLKAGADPNMTNHDGRTAYDIAVCVHNSRPHLKIGMILRRHINEARLR
jgi:uncharacterized protein